MPRIKLAPNYLTRNRHGIFYFRIVIPASLRPPVNGKREVRRSLRTDSERLVQSVLGSMLCTSIRSSIELRAYVAPRPAVVHADQQTRQRGAGRKDIQPSSGSFQATHICTPDGQTFPGFVRGAITFPTEARASLTATRYMTGHHYHPKQQSAPQKRPERACSAAVNRKNV